jgi:hypothetical protein
VPVSSEQASLGDNVGAAPLTMYLFQWRSYRVVALLPVMMSGIDDRASLPMVVLIPSS